MLSGMTPTIGQFRQLRRSGPRRKVDVALARTHFSRAVRSAMAPAELALCSGPSASEVTPVAGSDLESRLVCVECGMEAEADARGWRMFLTVDDEPVPYCEQCAEAEFGGRDA
jgi:hypothetical protein